MTALILSLALAAPPDSALAVPAGHPVTELSVEEVREMLLGRTTTWPDGRPVALVLGPARSPEMKWMCALVGLPEFTYRSLLFDKAMRGQIEKPRTTKTADETAAAIAMRRGSLGPLPASKVSRATPALVLRTPAPTR